MMKKMTLGVLLVLLLVVAGCATYGSIKPVGYEVAIESLERNWQDYKVYWTGIDIGEPTAIMFQPKSSEVALVGDRWYPVENEQSLLRQIGWMETNYLFYPSVWTILGADGKSDGYLYTGCRLAVARQIDEKTLLVYGLPATLRGEDREFMKE